METIVDSMELNIQGVAEVMNLKRRIERYSISILYVLYGDYFGMTVNDPDVIKITGVEDN